MFVWDRKDLNDAQVAAIEHPDSVFLVACPGSGKTRTLTLRFPHISSWQINHLRRNCLEESA
ncbi:hypothetical protein QYZ29_21625, partial [Xanthomonas campestris pv. campestris]|uniref:UvrD-helicase domain-containing protein n=1 Tax=Xanthomonas campestris TaxID=339 RepID=UPI002AD221E4